MKNSNMYYINDPKRSRIKTISPVTFKLYHVLKIRSNFLLVKYNNNYKLSS